MLSVSILISSYNYGRYLERAIESALTQTYPNIEVVVVDDGSTDESRSVIGRYAGRITAIFQQNQGQASAVNAAFAACNGDIVTFLDADDYFRRYKIAALVKAYEQNSDAAWVFHELAYVDAADVPVAFAQLGNGVDAATLARRRRLYWPAGKVDLRQTYVLGQPIDYACPAQSALSFRRSALARVLPAPEVRGLASDEFIKLSVSALFPGLHIASCLAVQRLHGRNAATVSGESGRAREIQESKTYVRTAYAMRDRFPQLAKTTDRQFAAALGRLIGLEGFVKAFGASAVRDYIGTLPFVETVNQLPRLLIHYARTRLRELRRPSVSRPDLQESRA